MTAAPKNESAEYRHKQTTQSAVSIIMTSVTVLFYYAHWQYSIAVLTVIALGFLVAFINLLVTSNVTKWRKRNEHLRADKWDAIRWAASLVIFDTVMIVVVNPPAVTFVMVWTLMIVCAQLDLHGQRFRTAVFISGVACAAALMFLVENYEQRVEQKVFAIFSMACIVGIVEFLERLWSRELDHTVAAEIEKAELLAKAEIMERDAQLGTHSRMIAHELNNLIMMLEYSLKKKEIDREMMERKIYFITRINKIVLEGFRGRDALGATKVGDIIADVKLLLEKQLQYQNILLRIEVEPKVETLPMREYSGTMFLILRNLVKNAADAIMAKSQPSIEECVTITFTADNKSVEIQVKDTGTGMTPEMKANVLKGAGLSTKKDGYGIGSKFVHDQCGRNGFDLDVQTELGQGTTFTLRAPIAKDSPLAA